MTMWWVAGSLRGPHAVVSLRDTDTNAVVAEMPILGVPDHYDPEPGRLVRVVGDRSHAPVIHDRSVTLWPAEQANLGGAPANDT